MRNFPGYLLRLQKLTRDNKDVLVNQAYNSALFVIQTLLTLVTIRLITTNIPIDDFGIYRLVLAVQSLCSLSTIPGLNKTIAGYVAKENHKTVRSLILKSGLFGFIGIGILLILSIWEFQVNENIIKGKLYLLVAMSFIPYLVFARYEYILQGLQKYKELFFIKSFLLMSQLLCIYVSLDVYKLGIIALASTQLLLQGVLFTLIYFRVQRYIINSNEDPGAFRHSLIVSTLGISGKIIFPSLQVFLSFSLGDASLALYFLGKRFGDLTSNGITQFVKPITIRLARIDRDSHKREISKHSVVILFFGGLSYLLYLLLLDAFGHILISGDYLEAIFLAKIYGLIIVLTPLYAFYNAFVIYEKQNKIYAISIYVEQAVQVVLYVIFIKSYGLMGIIVIDLICYCIRFLLLSVNVRFMKNRG